VAEGPVQFGNLLVKLNLISQSDLEDALHVAPQFGLPIGRTLVLSGRLSEQELQVAVELQPLINQQKYPIESAKKIIALVRSGISPVMALKSVRTQVAPPEQTTLGQLLLEANLITQVQLDEAQRGSYQNGMRLGRMLVLNGYIDDALLKKALDQQYMVRLQRITRADAIANLTKAAGASKSAGTAPSTQDKSAAAPAAKAAPSPAPSVPASPASKKVSSSKIKVPFIPGKKSVRFTEFLVSSGLATETEMLNALETSLNEKLSLGEAIVKMGIISQRVFDISVDLYNKVSAGDLALHDAANQLHKTVFGDPKHGPGQNSPVLGELLKMTELVTDRDIDEAIALSSKYPSVIGKMLVLSGAIDEATLIGALRCQFMLKNGYLKLDDGVRALKHSKDNKMSFDDALEELGLRRNELPEA
jgi:hypothetical protein